MLSRSAQGSSRAGLSRNLLRSRAGAMARLGLEDGNRPSFPLPSAPTFRPLCAFVSASSSGGMERRIKDQSHAALRLSMSTSHSRNHSNNYIRNDASRLVQDHDQMGTSRRRSQSQRAYSTSTVATAASPATAGDNDALDTNSTSEDDQIEVQTKQQTQQQTQQQMQRQTQTQEPKHLVVDDVISNISDAASFHRKWDVELVRRAVDEYELCLKHFYHEKKGTAGQALGEVVISAASPEAKARLLSPIVAKKAFVAVLRCKIPTNKLSRRVRSMETYIGTLGQTEMTDALSFRMLQANGKSGNIGRALQLLSFRKSKEYEPQKGEFIHAIAAIKVAGTYLKKDRNIFLSDQQQPPIDNPTRWLDAILLNMSQRGFPLTTELANQMINTYTTTGSTGKASHYFYTVFREESEPTDGANTLETADGPDEGKSASYRGKPMKVTLTMRSPPPYHKIPSQVKGKFVQKPGSDARQLKLDRECDPSWSVPLSEAFAFADSLSHGACGHDPVELNLISYTTLMKACVNRGGLWRAMQIIDEIMPANNIQPDAMAYDTLLGGLSRVGDVPTMHQYYDQMVGQGVAPTQRTVETIAGGMLNLGDVPNAITIVQDFFNQHSVLPPYTMHLKIIEFALGRGLVYEAKRHVYFLQQLWKWEKNKYHTDEFVELVTLTQLNPKLSKEALQKLFRYFGEELEDADFF